MNNPEMRLKSVKKNCSDIIVDLRYSRFYNNEICLVRRKRNQRIEEISVRKSVLNEFL